VTKVIENARSLVRPSLRALRKSSQAWQGQLQPLTAPLRLLPDFIIIGAQKCGTTSLYRFLTEQHPGIAPALEKEIHFFDIAFGKGLNWYRAHFPTILYKQYLKKVRGQDLITGEASPYYIFYPHASRRIFETVPQVKLIVLLRNPVERAYSHYHHQVTRGRETLSFEQAIEAEPQRLSGELEKILADENYISFNQAHFSYLARGIYVDQLQAWTNLFPPEQLLILNSEAFFADPAATYRQVVAFLNVPESVLQSTRKRNVGSYQKMSPATRQRLVEYFRPHNQRLYEYLGTNFNWDR
jgi:hypothetical protein